MASLSGKSEMQSFAIDQDWRKRASSSGIGSGAIKAALMFLSVAAKPCRTEEPYNHADAEEGIANTKDQH